MDDFTTKRSFDLRATRMIDVLAFFDVIHGGLYNQALMTPGRLVQELNVCTVGVIVYGQVLVMRMLVGTVTLKISYLRFCLQWDMDISS